MPFPTPLKLPETEEELAAEREQIARSTAWIERLTRALVEADREFERQMRIESLERQLAAARETIKRLRDRR